MCSFLFFLFFFVFLHLISGLYRILFFPLFVRFVTVPAINCEQRNILEKQNPIKSYTHNRKDPFTACICSLLQFSVFVCLFAFTHLYWHRAFNLKGRSKISHNHMKERRKEWRRNMWRTKVQLWSGCHALYRLHWIDGGWQNMVSLRISVPKLSELAVYIGS